MGSLQDVLPAYKLTSLMSWLSALIEDSAPSISLQDIGPLEGAELSPSPREESQGFHNAQQSLGSDY